MTQSLQQLEHELEQARRHGRWLADDELASLQQQRQAEIAQQQQSRIRRRKLLLLTVLCVLIPPLWPLALGLVLYLLFPRTTKRYGLMAGVIVLAIGGLLIALLITVLVVLLLALL